ncbi:MAG: hypothetical protein JSS81_24425 [Acidobacteria bacterium]|nr:hypothetical protein [Acidobacteriota bacterium]
MSVKPAADRLFIDPLKTPKTLNFFRVFLVFLVFLVDRKQLFAGLPIPIQSIRRFPNESPDRSITVPNSSGFFVFLVEDQKSERDRNRHFFQLVFR